MESGSENISGNRRPFAPHFRATRRVSPSYSGNVDKTLSTLLRCAALAWLMAAGAFAHAQAATEALTAEAVRFAKAELIRLDTGRFEVVPGTLDARLRLSPCEEVHTYLPQGARLWGKSRVGVRCVKGVTRWNVYLPLTVNVYGPAWVTKASLPAGHVLAAADFHQVEVNLAENLQQAPFADASTLLGRSLARPFAPGQVIDQNSLKARQWFAAGEKVQIRVAGNGFAVAGTGEAVTAGMEGLPARVRTEGGRMVTGQPVGERMLEIAL